MAQSTREAPASPPSPPALIGELADACVRFVEKAVGIAPDYTFETLPLVDHWLREAREAALARARSASLVSASQGGQAPVDETLRLVAAAAGAYFGEVVLRRYPGWWRLVDDGTDGHRVELREVFLAFHPMGFAYALLLRPEPPPVVSEPRDDDAPEHDDEEEEELETVPVPGDDPAALLLDEDDKQAIMAKLAELPPVREDDFFALSTRAEMIDVVVDALRARRIELYRTDDGLERDPPAFEEVDYDEL
jgi:hypothetical protein